MAELFINDSSSHFDCMFYRLVRVCLLLWPCLSLALSYMKWTIKSNILNTKHRLRNWLVRMYIFRYRRMHVFSDAFWMFFISFFRRFEMIATCATHSRISFWATLLHKVHECHSIGVYCRCCLWCAVCNNNSGSIEKLNKTPYKLENNFTRISHFRGYVKLCFLITI